MRIVPNDSDLEMMIAKFLINLPDHQLHEDRIWVHLQKMFYYFIDEIIDLEPLSNFQMQDKQMKQFFFLVVCKLPTFFKLDPNRIMKMINDGYSNTPVYGVIIFNLTQTKILLVQSHKPANMFGIPKGKINEGQTPIQCARREVQEQVGIHVVLDQNQKIQINYSKNYCFYICKIDESNINVSVVKNTEAQKSRGLQKISKEIKSLIWLQIHKSQQLRLNVATKKVIDKISSDRANSSPSSKNKKIGSTGKIANGYMEVERGDRNRRSNKYIEISKSPPKNSLHGQQESKCPFDSYSIKNRKMHEKLFSLDTD